MKDILDIANTLGGYIVIGVSERASGLVWDGLTDDQAISFDTSRLNRFLQNYADPPINTAYQPDPARWNPELRRRRTP